MTLLRIIPERAPGAWTSNLTGAGRLLPAKWRIGGPDRQQMLRSIEAVIANDVIAIIGELVAAGLDDHEAAIRAGALWHELADDGVCRGTGLALIAVDQGRQR